MLTTNSVNSILFFVCLLSWAGICQPKNSVRDCASDSLVDQSQQLARKKIMYNSSSHSDCSGIFLQVLKAAGQECRDLAKSVPEMTRSSQQIHDWYHQQGLLQSIVSPKKSGQKIKPGSILFFGRSKKRVEHVGIVTWVERNKQGQTINYHLFHGRKPGVVASVTKWHHATNKVPFGNGQQKWVGIANY